MTKQKLKLAKPSNRDNMFWVKQYCKVFNLDLQGNNIRSGNNIIATIDYYDDVIYFLNEKTKYNIKDLAHAIMENFKLH